MKAARKTWCGRSWRIARSTTVAYLSVVLLMLFLETWLVYPAPLASEGNWNPTGLEYEDVWFESEDGTKLHGWFVPHPNAKRVILYCHGNGEHIAMNADLAAHLRDRLQASVFLFDYRGYGRSEGSPSEQGCIADGAAAQQWLAKRTRIQPSEVVLMGRSLGGAIAIALAADLGAKALVVECSFTQMPEVAALHFPWLPVRWAMSNRYDSISRLRQYAGPVFQSHGTDDTLIPIAMGRQLFGVVSNPLRKLVEHAGCDHTSPWPTGYYDDMAAFLDEVDASRISGTAEAKPASPAG